MLRCSVRTYIGFTPVNMSPIIRSRGIKSGNMISTAHGIMGYCSDFHLLYKGCVTPPLLENLLEDFFILTAINRRKCILGRITWESFRKTSSSLLLSTGGNAFWEVLLCILGSITWESFRKTSSSSLLSTGGNAFWEDSLISSSDDVSGFTFV